MVFLPDITASQFSENYFGLRCLFLDFSTFWLLALFVSLLHYTFLETFFLFVSRRTFVLSSFSLRVKEVC